MILIKIKVNKISINKEKKKKKMEIIMNREIIKKRLLVHILLN